MNARFLAQLTSAVAFLAAVGCTNPRSEFLGTRVADTCDGQWPICATIAGCLLGDTSYIEGKLPGAGRVAIQIFEPSEVTATFYLFEVGAAGQETVINFNEERCRSRVRQSITGKVFFNESQNSGGIVKRKAELTGEGDHLIDFTSDAVARYYFKIDVLPLRLRDQGAGMP